MRKEKWEAMAARVQNRLQKYGDVTVTVSALKAVLNGLTERQRDITLFYYRDLDTPTEIADTFGISTKRVREVIRDFDIKVFLRTSTDNLDDLYLLSDMGVPARVIYALRRGGLRTVSGVATWYKENESLRKHIRCIGPTALEYLGDALAALKKE